MLHRCGEEGRAKSPSKGTETENLLKLAELSAELSAAGVRGNATQSPGSRWECEVAHSG